LNNSIKKDYIPIYKRIIILSSLKSLRPVGVFGFASFSSKAARMFKSGPVDPFVGGFRVAFAFLSIVFALIKG